MSGDIPYVEDDDPEYYDDPSERCDRCGEDFPEGTGGLVTEDCGPGAVAEHVFCDDCLDSFTAWRLSKDPPSSSDFPVAEVPAAGALDVGPLPRQPT